MQVRHARAEDPSMPPAKAGQPVHLFMLPCFTDGQASVVLISLREMNRHLAEQDDYALDSTRSYRQRHK